LPALQSKRHVGRRFAIGISYRIVYRAAHFLETHHVDIQANNGLGNNMHLALMVVHGFQAAIPGIEQPYEWSKRYKSSFTSEASIMLENDLVAQHHG
jgi:hypothetical protein